MVKREKFILGTKKLSWGQDDFIFKRNAKFIRLVAVRSLKRRKNALFPPDCVFLCEIAGLFHIKKALSAEKMAVFAALSPTATSLLEFAIDKNLRVVEPYLIYYALLNCCRAIVFTSPNVEWNSGEVMTMTHTKIINLTVDSVNRFNKKEAKRVRNILEKARDYRELFSYKFPAKGINNFNVDSNLAIEECKFLSEIAQYQSAVLEKSYDKNVSDYLGLDWEILKHGYEYAGKNYDFVDREDGYRLDYIDRKQPRPFSLYMMMTEGMVEDFFGAWCPENDDMKQEVYNPDMNWQIIFPVP